MRDRERQGRPENTILQENEREREIVAPGWGGGGRRSVPLSTSLVELARISL